MKKRICILLIIVMVLSAVTVSNAANSIDERPDIKVSVNGIIGTYSNTPIISKGRTLLPLRDLLTSLGVLNDDKHIIWDNKEKTVKAIKGSKEITVKIGDRMVMVNDTSDEYGSSAMTSDVAPLIYNSRVYLPARVVAEAFQLHVDWDEDTKTVLISDKYELKSTDGVFSLTLPSYWTEEGVYDEQFQLEAWIALKLTSITGTTASKLDYNDFKTFVSASLQGVVLGYNEYIQNKSDMVKVSEPLSLTINGNPTEQYVVTLDADEGGFTAIVTFINGPNYYGSITSQSPNIHYNGLKDEMLKIVSTVKGF